MVKHGVLDVEKTNQIQGCSKGFCKVEVMNGETTSFWYDDWSNLGRLIEVAGDRGVIVMGIRRQASVAEAWTGRRRRRHRAVY